LTELSTLVLCDVLAGMPMRQLVRLQRLGQPRLAALCSLAWVTQRMTHVHSNTVLEAYLHREELYAFCGSGVLKRLHGKVIIDGSKMEYPEYVEAYAAMVNRVPGKLHLHFNFIELTQRRSLLLDSLLDCIRNANVIYVTSCKCIYGKSFSEVFPNLIFIYTCLHLEDKCFIWSSTPSMNGRFAVDVLRAVLPPADVDAEILAMFRHFACSQTEKSEIFSYHPYHLRYFIRDSYTIFSWNKVPLVDMTKLNILHPVKLFKRFFSDKKTQKPYSVYVPIEQ